MAKKKQIKDAEYKYIEKHGKKYLLTGVHNDNGYWSYDIKDVETGEHYYKISYNKLKEYL